MAKKVKANPKTGNPGTSEFNGGLFGLIGISILQFLLIVFTLTLGTAWAVCMKFRWYAKHTRVNGKQLEFDGKGIQLFGNCIKWFILSVITLGIYTFWLGIKLEKWKMKHTFYKEETAMQPAMPMQNGGYPVMPTMPTMPTMPMQPMQMPPMPQNAPYGYPMMPPVACPYPQMPYGYPNQTKN